MTLSPGSRLGPYEIVAPLGAGGMGEVYRARDPRLGREVAIKVLPAEMASDTERLRRFEQEAKAVSALNHPHIVTLHEIGSSEFGPYLVLEKIDGQSLRELLRAGALPVKRVLTLGAQIAEGLAKAHGAGIVHRDLKPENVMVTGDGFAKILDFGLAKLVYPELETAAIGDATTLAEKTGTGMILGTIGYLSPEQASGGPADFRSDQFALGALLYELATGERPFRRETVPESLAAVIREDPEPLRTRNPALPPQLGWIVERCLAKDPSDRYASTRDLARDLADLRDRLSEVGRETATEPARSPLRARVGRLLPWSIALLAVAAATGVELVRSSSPGAVPLPTFRALTFRKGVITGARFSPDGQTVYYSGAFGAEPPRVFMTRLDGTKSVPLELPPASLLSVSSKGELALLLGEGRNPHNTEGTLARVPALGGTPRPLVDNAIDADWSPDGERLAILRADYTVEFPAGQVLISDAQFPRLAPNGDLLASISTNGVAVVDLQGRHVVDHDILYAFGLAWRPDGREIWFTGDRTGAGADRVLFALGLDGRVRQVASAPGAMTIEDIARNGKHALVTTGASWWSIRSRGRAQPAEANLDLLGRTDLAGLSDDGRWALLYEYRQPGGGTYLAATDGSRTIHLSDGVALGLSPDGAWALIAPQAGVSSPQLLLTPTGAGAARSIEIDPSTHPESFGSSARWSADGKKLFVRPAGSPSVLFLEDSGKWRLVAPNVGPQFAVSPDGETVAARHDGTVALYPVDGGAPLEIAAERGRPLRWSPDGKWLYLAEDHVLRARVYRRELASGRIEPWLDIGPSDPAGVTGVRNVCLSSDGATYAYLYSALQSTLYLAEGLR